MFDTKVLSITHEHNSPSRVDVHEHRAPTDDSVRLLREMEDKARKQIVSRMLMDIPEINVSGILIHEVMAVDLTQKAYFVFKLNGKENIVPVSVSKYLSFKSSPNDLIEEIYKQLSNYIAVEILGKAIPKFVGA